MTQAEFERAKKPASVRRLLSRVENSLEKDYQATAYNFLIDYTENPEWFSSSEGGRLLILSLEVLHAI